MPFVTTTTARSTNLYYQDLGDGQPVVLIHCWPLSHRAWERQTDALVEAGFRCIAYDRRGFGESDKPGGGYDYDTLAADLRDLLITLDLREVVLVGHSMGGGEVARFLRCFGKDRVSKTILIGTALPFLVKTDDNPEGLDRQVIEELAMLLKHDRIGFIDGWVRHFYNLDENPSAVSDDLIRYTKAIAWLASPLATRECFRTAVMTDFRPDLPSITVPTLIIHGEADRNVALDISSKRAAALIADSRLSVIQGAPHGLTVTHAEQLSALMLDFIRS
jgi:pimeloyl-ACP methyl ester carboxylesterase